MGLSLVWQREESLGRYPKKIDSIKAKWHHLILQLTNSSIDHLFQMFFIDSLQNEEFEIESIAPLSNIDRSDFHQLSKNFLFHSIRLTRKEVHLLLESNVRHENEENFFYSKKRRFVYSSNEDEIFDNETKFVFRQRTSLLQLGLMSDEQDNQKLFNENMIRRVFIVQC